MFLTAERRLSRPPARFWALALLLALALPSQASALERCEFYTAEELGALEPAARIAWLNEELALCDKNDAARARDYANRGLAYIALGQYRIAIDNLSEALALDPALAVVLKNRGTAYARLGLYPEAIADYNRAIALDPDYAEAYNGRCWVYAAARGYRTALADCDKAVALDPASASAHDSRAVALAGLGRIDEAVAEIRIALQLEPERALAYQRFLKAQGFYKAALDGDFGRRSEAALRAWFAAGMPGNETRS